VTETELVFDAVDWGRTAISEWLTLAALYSTTHGKNILAKLEPHLPSEVEITEGSTPLQKTRELQTQLRNHPNLLSEEFLKKMARKSLKDPVLSRLDYQPEAYFALGLSGVSSDLQEALKKVEGLDEVSLILFTDGQEQILVRREGREFIARIKRSNLPTNQVRENLALLPGFVSPTELLVLEENKKGCRLLLLTKKINEDRKQKIEDEEMIGIARELAKIGFVPDLHLGNFVKDNTAKLWYVDQDVLDHILSEGELEPSGIVSQQVDGEVKRFLAKHKEVTLGS
jgi:hypothetical protein